MAKVDSVSGSCGWALFLLRVGLGWLFVWAGWSKIINPEWSAAGFLTHTENYGEFFAWFALEQNIGWVNFLNQWGQLLIGLSLVSGVMLRWSAFWGSVMMILYYLPDLNFPYIGEHGVIVDDHLINLLVLWVLAESGSGRYMGLDKWFKSLSFVKGTVLEKL